MKVVARHCGAGPQAWRAADLQVGASGSDFRVSGRDSRSSAVRAPASWKSFQPGWRSAADAPEGLAEDAGPEVDVAVAQAEPANQTAGLFDGCGTGSEVAIAGFSKQFQQQLGKALAGGIVGEFGRAGQAAGGHRRANEFVEADGDGLAEVHRVVRGAGRDVQQRVAEAEVFVREAGFLAAEQECGRRGGEMALEHARAAFEAEDGEMELAILDAGRAGDMADAGERFGERPWYLALCSSEEFMLAANEAVASYLERRGIPSLYRIHEKPEAKKVMEFEEIAATFGYSLGVELPAAQRFRPSKRDERDRHTRFIERVETKELEITPRHYQRLTQRLEGKPEERILSYLMLRSLKQARYSEENVGHFALAAETYTHFTSPIRRYPDLIVHRILKAALEREGGSARVDRAMRSDHLASAAAKQEAPRKRRGVATERRHEPASIIPGAVPPVKPSLAAPSCSPRNFTPSDWQLRRPSVAPPTPNAS